MQSYAAIGRNFEVLGVGFKPLRSWLTVQHARHVLHMAPLVLLP